MMMMTMMMMMIGGVTGPLWGVSQRYMLYLQVPYSYFLHFVIFI